MFKNYIKKVIEQELLRSYNRFDNEIGIIREAITEATEERGKDYIVCKYCKCILNKQDAHKVVDERLIGDGFVIGDLYYCHKCKPNYDKIEADGTKYKTKTVKVK